MNQKYRLTVFTKMHAVGCRVRTHLAKMHTQTHINVICSILLLLLLDQTFHHAVFADEPFKLDAEEKRYIEDSSQGSLRLYPSPRMVHQVPEHAPVQPKPSLKAHAFETQRHEPVKAQIEMKVILPPAFLGVWQVQGERTKVEALPDFQAGAEHAFALNTNNTWQIDGSGGNYTMSSNEGVHTQLYVQSVQGSTASIRYQHAIGNTMAQEAFVMSLVPGGAQFNGLTQISIVKQGEKSPRAKVTYQLVGYRRQ